MQLREKQKARIYGILEGQFRKYFDRAERTKGITGENLLLVLLERRLDNAVFRMGFAASRNQARQLVRHGLMTVNGRRVNIPSFQVRVGDVVAVHETSMESPIIKLMIETYGSKTVPAWVEDVTVTPEAVSAKVARFPSREEIDCPIVEHLIVELYSR